MKKLLFPFFVMLMFFSVAKAEFVNNIVINGNDRVSSETIILLGGIEKDKEYEVRVEAPGMKKGDFGVTVKDGVLTITGEKRAESSDDRKGYAYRESRQGKFSRSFRLPEEVNEKKIGASYTSGVLSVSVPRSKPIEVKEVEVQIK